MVLVDNHGGTGLVPADGFGMHHVCTASYLHVIVGNANTMYTHVHVHDLNSVMYMYVIPRKFKIQIYICVHMNMLYLILVHAVQVYMNHMYMHVICTLHVIMQCRFRSGHVVKTNFVLFGDLSILSSTV